MSTHQVLLSKISAAMKLTDTLSKNENDMYAKCFIALEYAQQFIDVNMDRSAECKCGCHKNELMHCVPCSCYNGDPEL